MIKDLVSSGLQAVMSSVLTGSPLPPALMSAAMTVSKAAAHPLTRPLVKKWFEAGLEKTGIEEEQIVPLLSGVPMLNGKVEASMDAFAASIIAIETVVADQLASPQSILCTCPECKFTFGREVRFK